MRKHIISASLLLLLAACQMQEEYVPVESGFTAEIETFAGETRTSLNESNSVVWSDNDLIAVFQGCSVADKFEVTDASAGKTTGSFKEVTSVGGGGFESGNEIPDNVAVYPYMEDLECANGMFSDEDAYVYKIENVHYPSTQMYQENSFPDDAFVMVAVTSGVKDNKLRFLNASGALRLRIKGDATVKSISIEGNADEPLGGYAVLKAYRDGSAPELESFGTSYGTVTLDCGNGVRLDEDTATEFIIALPPTDFENGFTVTIHPKDGDPDVRKTDKRNSVRRSRVLNMPEITFGVPEGPSTGEAVDLNADGQTANSYIISEAGTYRFAAVKGNSSESVGDVASVEVLWESFGTSVKPSVGDLIKEVSYSDGDILFSTADNFRKGNAVIAAKDASGTILWSWHIWLTDEPEGQVYYKNAGTMMDRNLGATSAEPGDVGALGLLYQWGRKDPFLGSSDISNNTIAESTGSWPSTVSSSSNGTIEYAVKNPMTFITATPSSNYDWHYSSRNNKLWQSEKTIYDPCPAGWRVPDGGDNGVWSEALGSSSSFEYDYSSTDAGVNFSGNFGSASTIWYPASGFRKGNDGSLDYVGSLGNYWSVTPNSYYAYNLYFDYYGYVLPSSHSIRASGHSVRCLKEDSSTPPTETPKEYVNLSAEGTANSYIVSQAGDYKFEAVKGNSYESVGSVSEVQVLWESFGTDVTPSVGDLFKDVSYSDGYILFSTADNFRKGNAVIAAKDASGTILWSWHIWLTDEPEGQVYYKGAGTMMDRNLGATSATPGDVGALGLLYQWGRKDPFLGSSSISSNAVAKSTGSWPSAVSSSSSRGTIEYAVKNPMTFITYNSSNTDWYYTGSSSTDNTRWQSEKTIYDPCPAGWRVPDGGSKGVWSKALGSSSSYTDNYDSSREGINFSGKFGSASLIWYPASGYRGGNGGSLHDVGYYGFYWSVTPYSDYAYGLYFYYDGRVLPSSHSGRALGHSVRCFKEDSSTPPTETPKEYVNLSAEGTANSYIVSQEGDYKFGAVKGNSSESVGDVASVEVLWESFGTDVTPSVGDLVKEVSYSDGDILFSTADDFRKGNAVIAAKDASGTILWSWHIWLTDAPEEQVYYNNAGTMMDRNLGATSAEPGDVGALGLLYQWGRKDPFLGSSDISSNTVAKSTGSWPSTVSSSSSNGTIEYAVKNPMTFITRNSSNSDWYYTGSSSTDNTRWESEKTIYDPCPAGWRVPDGGSNGVWSKALGSASSYSDTYDSSKEGINFSGRFGNASPIWYPASGYRYYDDGSLHNVGYYGYYWSVAPNSNYAYYLYFYHNGYVNPSYSSNRAGGRSVRCLKEGSSTPPTETPKEYENLSAEGTANSYIVSQEGDYKFEAVKGNSSESVGDVASVEVLWESFGTDETPSVGDLIQEVSYSDGYILFSTPSSFQEGNAVIAAKNSYGEILWSWHIWFTDEPREQVYTSGAGTMMDRNLGAVSATPGEVRALGLLYQWGRKDPFLGSSKISNNAVAESTGSWPSAVSSSSSRGTVEYAVKNPMTFITATLSSNYDWHYSSRNNKLWQSEKTIYDPCPAGWRVPDGGSNGVWSKALGSSSYYNDTYDSSKEGINFSGRFGNASPIWYPASGCRNANDGSLCSVGSRGIYWSVAPTSSYAYGLYFYDYGDVSPSGGSSRAYGLSVRCFKEDSSTPPTETPKEYVNLSAEGTANSYIVSQEGDYKFEAVKGNSYESVCSVSEVEVLWESFGTDETPSVGDLVKEVSYSDGYILFSTADNFREGNAVIAAKDASGTILWSWHIWLTDEPEGQVYYNNAGTMMDRNLGATSATPGDVGALCLLYQWGRKDPFLGSSSISSSTVAKSTGSWPSAVSSSSSRGTVEYAVKNPMTFITATSSSSNYDWHYSSRNNKLWQSEKTIYDPCPAGWRVPDGGSNGVWSKALGSSSYYNDTYDSSKEGMNFSGKFGNASTIWYPASGYRSGSDGSLSGVGFYGGSWSVTPDSSYAYSLGFNGDGYVVPSDSYYRALGQSVRCLKEDSSTPPTETPKEYVNLSAEGTANSYIVSQEGDYKFEAVKGNSSESVGSVSEVEVLWESFGTDETPSVGDLVKEVSYSDGYILFSTADNFRKGNAVIAAKNSSGTILWSWHIWLTDEPEGQVYYNNAGTMMDRDLGATSATPGDVGALGLLYQWGRKDPFRGSSSISSSTVAKSTGSWPSAVSSSSSSGTVEYAVKNPMTFITATSSSNYDWHYSSRNNKLWQSEKTIYDPCPVGWRVPDGESNGVWSKALGSASSYNDTYDDSREGINFSGKFGNTSTIWYPASGYRYGDDGLLSLVGRSGYYWSVTPNSSYAYGLGFYSNGSVGPSSSYDRASGRSVRCLQE